MPPDPGVVAFVHAALPPPPARVLEVGAGQGKLAAALRAAGYDVVAIDPQRTAAGLHIHGDPAHWPADLREHLHPLGDIRAALSPAFSFGEPVRGAYLYRWDLDLALRAVEERLVADGALPATGARLVGIRR